jgi:hypothetical protein
MLGARKFQISVSKRRFAPIFLEGLNFFEWPIKQVAQVSVMVTFVRSSQKLECINVIKCYVLDVNSSLCAEQ